MFLPRVLARGGLAGYEPYAVDAFLTLLESAPRGAVLDIGANVGIYGLLAGTYSERTVIAFEPAPDTADVARSTAAANAVPLTVEEIALGAHTGMATLYLSDVTDTSNSLDPDFRAHSKQIEVPLQTLDSYLHRTGLVPAIVKIDTEATEYLVLRGASQLLARHRPWILCEVLPRKENELREEMAPWGYTHYHLTGTGPIEPATRIAGDPNMKNLMYLFAPEPVEDAFWQRMGLWRSVLGAPA
jgi:FkbM family methyltransferase